MSEELRAHVGIATLALLCYRLLFCSARELSLTALLFCAACAWCAGQLAAAAAGAGVSLPTLTASATAAAAAASAAAAARTVCSSALFSSSAREACWNYTEYFIADETSSSS
jgi:hypothetical protein